MEAFIKLNNSILDCGLTPNELKVAVCLYSCVFGNRYYVQIKQSTIAAKCGIKKVETVANIICNLQRKGIIEGVSRPHKANGWLGTYIYKLKTVVQKGFFQTAKKYSRQAERRTVKNVSFCMPCCYKEKRYVEQL